MHGCASPLVPQLGKETVHHMHCQPQCRWLHDSSCRRLCKCLHVAVQRFQDWLHVRPQDWILHTHNICQRHCNTLITTLSRKGTRVRTTHIVLCLSTHDVCRSARRTMCNTPHTSAACQHVCERSRRVDVHQSVLGKQHGTAKHDALHSCSTASRDVKQQISYTVQRTWGSNATAASLIQLSFVTGSRDRS